MRVKIEDCYTPSWALLWRCGRSRVRTERYDFDAIEHRERKIIDSGSPFGVALAALRERHAGWPFMDSRLDCAAWLDEMLLDDDALAPNLYFVISRGFSILPPGEASQFKSFSVDNYESAKSNPEVVSKEIARLRKQGFMVPWKEWCRDNGLDEDTLPIAKLAIGVVRKKGKDRLVIDGSAPHGRSLNEAMDPPDTKLPSIMWAMAAMSFQGFLTKTDFSDAFLNHKLAHESVPLCVVEWEGELLAYTSLGFGFKSGPHQQQQTTLAIVRVALRRMRKAGIAVPEAPGLDHSYPDISAAPPGVNTLNAFISFLDDTGGFASSRSAAWFAFSHYITACYDLGFPVHFKEGKTESPAQLMHFLGFDLDTTSMTVSLHAERVQEIRDRLTRVAGQPSISVAEAQSLVGTLVFASTVIRIGRLYYRALLDAINELGPNPCSSTRITISEPIKESLDMWSSLMNTLNSVNANVRAMRPTVPSEIRTDASLMGWGWAGMDSHEYGRWPQNWIDNLGVWNPSKLEQRIWICELEVWACLFALRRLAPRMRNCRVVFRVDNLPVVFMMQKLSSRSHRCVRVLREIAWLSAAYDIEISVQWISTSDNFLADILSRRYCKDHDSIEWGTALNTFRREEAQNPEWDHWPAQSPQRPELLHGMQAACLQDFALRAATPIGATTLASLKEFY